MATASDTEIGVKYVGVWGTCKVYKQDERAAIVGDQRCDTSQS